MTSLKQKTAKGMIWSFIERFSVQGIQFVFQIALARILSPTDYGIIAMTGIFMAVSQSFIDSGFANALTRKNDRTDADYCTVFYFNIAISLAVYGILYASAPAIASFYRTEALTGILRVYALGLPINALGAIQRTQNTIKVEFREIAYASLAGAFAGGITGLFFALNGSGPWALVYSYIANCGVTTAILWLRGPWRPKAIFSLVSLRTMFSFGSKLLLSGVIDTLYKNLYQFVIGKKFSRQDLGFYSRADQFAQFPSSNITGILQRVTYPVLCSIGEDDARLLGAYRRFIKISAFIVFPLMIGLSAVSRPLVRVVLGEKWSYAGDILQILCISAMWYPLHAINLNALMVKGRSDLFFRVEIIKKAFGISILLVTMNFDIMTMAYGTIVSSLIALYINTYYTKKLLGYSFADQLKDVLPFAGISIVSCIPAIVLSVKFEDSPVFLAISIAVAVPIYIVMAGKLRFAEMDEARAFIKNIGK